MWGIVAITRQGLEQARALQRAFPGSVIYSLPRWHEPDTAVIEGTLGVFTGKLFAMHRTLIFITATGIAVRSIAPYLQSKLTDPAVVVMDEQGQFVISLVSGHVGGANAVAQAIARATDATPVITTASDVQGLVAVDTVAQTHHLRIASAEDAKNITAMMVNGRPVALRNESRWQLPSYFPAEDSSTEGLVVVSNRQTVTAAVPHVKLIPCNITLGVGCRRAMPGGKIIAFLSEQLRAHNIDVRSVGVLASVDRKADEGGIHEAAKHFGVPAVFVSSEAIGQVEHAFAASPFVKAQIGVSSVCEPAAYLAGGCRGSFICGKQAHEGITVAIFESDNAINQ